jgi:hypothetical protein
MRPLLLAIVLTFTCFSIQKLPELMPVHKLNWSEYKEVPPKDSPYSAATGYEWSMDITTNSYGEISADVHCYFLPYYSYTRTSDSVVLAHENYHLVLANIYCQQLRKALKAISGCKNCEETVNSMYQMTWQKMEDEQYLYDLQTQHSLNRTEQTKWEAKINKLKNTQQ